MGRDLIFLVRLTWPGLGEYNDVSKSRVSRVSASNDRGGRFERAQSEKGGLRLTAMRLAPLGAAQSIAGKQAHRQTRMLKSRIWLRSRIGRMASIRPCKYGGCDVSQAFRAAESPSVARIYVKQGAL